VNTMRCKGLVRGGSRQRLREQRANPDMLSTSDLARCNASSETSTTTADIPCRTRSVTTPTPNVARANHADAPESMSVPARPPEGTDCTPSGGKRAQRAWGHFNPPRPPEGY